MEIVRIFSLAWLCVGIAIRSGRGHYQAGATLLHVRTLPSFFSAIIAALRPRGGVKIAGIQP
jgi:hypothetical protein